VSVSKRHNHESTSTTPSVHVVVESGTADKTDVQRSNAESDAQMWEADPTILKRTYGGDAIEALMA
jgi:hypothetical protein